MRFSLALFATALSIGSAFASNVLELTPDNFDEHVGKGKPALVELCVCSRFLVAMRYSICISQLCSLVWSLQGTVASWRGTASCSAWQNSNHLPARASGTSKDVS